MRSVVCRLSWGFPEASSGLLSVGLAYLVIGDSLHRVPQRTQQSTLHEHMTEQGVKTATPNLSETGCKVITIMF